MARSAPLLQFVRGSSAQPMPARGSQAAPFVAKRPSAPALSLFLAGEFVRPRLWALAPRRLRERAMTHHQPPASSRDFGAKGMLAPASTLEGSTNGGGDHFELGVGPPGEGEESRWL